MTRKIFSSGHRVRGASPVLLTGELAMITLS